VDRYRFLLLLRTLELELPWDWECQLLDPAVQELDQEEDRYTSYILMGGIMFILPYQRVGLQWLNYLRITRTPVLDLPLRLVNKQGEQSVHGMKSRDSTSNPNLGLRSIPFTFIHSLRIV
jgi:hypothetical protein